ncbi:hypothetical protein AB0901_31050 [Streptomyces roseifaciens]
MRHLDPRKRDDECEAPGAIGLRYTIRTDGGAVLGEWATDFAGQALRTLGDALTEADRFGVNVANPRKALELLNPARVIESLALHGEWRYEASGIVLHLWSIDGDKEA